MDYVKDAWRSGIYNSAIIVHHKEYVTDLNFEDDNVFFNIENLESLCKDCHNKEHFADEQEYIFDENGDVIKNEWQWIIQKSKGKGKK